MDKLQPVISRIGCCNSVLSSVPKKVMDKLQHLQNAAARLVTGTWKYKRGQSWLMHDDLHWLVIFQRVRYKLTVTVHRCRHRAPLYLAEYCLPVSKVPACQHLRFTRCHQLSVPQVRCSSFGTRAFSVVGPAVWKSLPDHLHDPPVDCKHFRSVRICLLDIRNVRTLEVLHNHALQISIYFPLMLLILLTVCAF